MAVKSLPSDLSHFGRSLVGYETDGLRLLYRQNGHKDVHVMSVEERKLAQKAVIKAEYRRADMSLVDDKAEKILSVNDALHGVPESVFGEAGFKAIAGILV